MKRIIKDYFTFSKKERVAITVLFLLIACFVAMPYLYTGKPQPPPPNNILAEYIEKSKKEGTGMSDDEKTTPYVAAGESGLKEKPAAKKESFPFDPNTLPQEGWQRLGLAEKTARTIVNYRNKGGKFRRPADINKIWGIKKEDAERLLPFVRLAVETPASQTQSFMQKEVTATKPAARKIPAAVEINTATEKEWVSLPGIGEVLAKRILKFREHAGGFTTIEQVRKTYGLADSVFQRISAYLKIDVKFLPQLDLNTVSAYDLRRRLNIDDAVARAMVAYRKRSGPYLSIDDLKKIVLMSDTLFQRIAPLVKVE
jgi:competence protein ComEA